MCEFPVGVRGCGESNNIYREFRHVNSVSGVRRGGESDNIYREFKGPVLGRV